MIIERISLKEWKEKYMQDMYLASFSGERSKEIEVCDFVLIAKDIDQNAVGFITCHDMDSETVYWQLGGALPNVKNTVRVMSHYIHFITWCLGKYKRITTRIENTNLPMLKMALKCGFLIQGTWNFKNKIYLELCYEQGG